MLILIDGFDHINSSSTTDEINDKWRSTTSQYCNLSALTRHGEGYSLLITTSDGKAELNEIDNIYYEKDASYSSGLIGFHYRVNQVASTAAYPFFQLINSLNQVQMGLRLSSQGHLFWERGTSAIYRSKGWRYVDTYYSQTSEYGAWVYFEILYYIADSILANTCVVKVDGDIVLNLPAGTDTQAQSTSNVAGFKLLHGGIYDRWYDNLYWASLTGVGVGHAPVPYDATINNGGGIYVQTMPPSGDANVLWVPNGFGDNYEEVDEAPPDEDTTYCYSSTTDNKNTFYYGKPENYDNLEYDVESANLFYGVQLVSRIRQESETEDAHFYHVAVKDGTDYELEPTATGICTTDYQYYVSILSVDPSTGLDWTRNGIDSYEFGVVRGDYEV